MDTQIIKNSFKAVKRDFDVLRVTLADWVNYLVHRNNHLESRIQALEKKVSELEQKDQVIITY